MSINLELKGWAKKKISYACCACFLRVEQIEPTSSLMSRLWKHILDYVFYLDKFFYKFRKYRFYCEVQTKWLKQLFYVFDFKDSHSQVERTQEEGKKYKNEFLLILKKKYALYFNLQYQSCLSRRTSHTTVKQWKWR